MTHDSFTHLTHKTSVLKQHTYTSSEQFHLEEGETMLAWGNDNFRALGENRTRDLPHTRSDILTTEPPGL